jgi:quinol monooxygenase YgiN
VFVQVIEGRLKDASGWTRLKELGETWQREEAHRAPGYQGFDFLMDRSDPTHFIEVVRFESHEKAQENSRRPETNRFFQQILALLDGEPRFIDCDLAQNTQSLLA